MTAPTLPARGCRWTGRRRRPVAVGEPLVGEVDVVVPVAGTAVEGDADLRRAGDGRRRGVGQVAVADGAVAALVLGHARVAGLGAGDLDCDRLADVGAAPGVYVDSVASVDSVAVGEPLVGQRRVVVPRARHGGQARAHLRRAGDRRRRRGAGRHGRPVRRARWSWSRLVVVLGAGHRDVMAVPSLVRARGEGRRRGVVDRRAVGEPLVGQRGPSSQVPGSPVSSRRPAACR